MRCTAKPSLRTRQMCTASISTSEHREHGDVQRVEAQQRVLPDLRPADQQVLGLAADERDVVHEAGADRDRPVRQLVPGQQVAGEREARA